MDFLASCHSPAWYGLDKALRKGRYDVLRAREPRVRSRSDFLQSQYFDESNLMGSQPH